MRYLFHKTLALITLMVGMTFQMSAQSTNVSLIVTTTDGNEVVYQLTEQSHLYFEEGTSLVIEDGSGNSTTYPLDKVRKIVCSEIAGTQEDTLSKLRLFPNPSHDSFIVSGLTQDCLARIYALDGRMVKEFEAKAGLAVGIDELTSGMYLLNINGQTLKLIKL